MATQKFTDDELELLTEEEREGLLDEDEEEGDEDENGDDGDADDGDADKGAAGDNDADADSGEADVADEANDGSKPAAEDNDGDADADAADDDDIETASQSSVTAQLEVPADVDQKLTELRNQRKELRAKWRDGELSDEEFDEQDDKLQQDLVQTHARVEAIKTQNEIQARNAVKTWLKDTVPAFLQQHPEYQPGTIRYEKLDRAVRELQRDTENKFDPSILAKAHKKVAEQIAAEFGVKTPPSQGKKPDGGKKRDLPPTLHNVPAADATDTDDGGEFAYLDRLSEKDPIAFETALAKLSPEQYDRYLATN